MKRLRDAGIAITALGMVVVLSGATVGSEPLQGDPAAEPLGPNSARIIVIELRTDTILVGDSIRAEASICDTTGSACQPALKAKWSVEPKGAARVAAKRGSMTLLTARRAGEMTLSAKQGKARGSTMIRVNEAPAKVPTDVAVDDVRLFVEPEEAFIDVGQVFRLTAWGCPLRDGTRTGANGVPDGLDDACLPVHIDEVNLDAGSPLTHLATVGPTAVLRLDTFPGGSGEDVLFVGAQITTPIGGTVPSLLARNEPSEDPLFYDMNLDGVVDAEDRAILSGSLPPDDQPIAADDPAFRARLDLTADGHIDSLDGVLFDMLVPVDLPDAESGASGDADDLVRADLDGDGMVTRADYDRWIELTDGVNLPVDSTGASGGSGAPEEARAPEDVNADGRIDLADGDAITQILVRQVEERLGSIPPEGEILGDIGGDGDVTIADAEAAYATFIEGRYDPRLDLNADTEVDAEDWEALGDLIEAHGGDPRPMGPAPTPPT